MKPPANARRQLLDGREYYSGEIYLESQDDTLRLQQAGFRQLEFQGRSLRSMKYRGLWPKGLVLDSLPASCQNVMYDDGDDRPAEHLDSELESYNPQLEFFKNVTWQIRNYPRPYDNQPDSVIGDRWYTLGTVYMKSLADSARLLPFGFFGFKALRDVSQDLAIGAAGSSAAQSYSGFSAYWPFSVDVQKLPKEVHMIAAKRHRMGVNEVIVRKKLFGN
jgi:hypothetical protein